MLSTVNSYLIRLAGVILSATLTRDELKTMLKALDDIRVNQDNFEKDSPIPLTLTDQARSKLKSFHGYDFSSQKDFEQIIQRLVKLIDITGKAGSADMAFISKSLEKNRNKWNVKFNGSFYEAKGKAAKVIDYLTDLANEPIPKPVRLSPAEFRELQEKGLHTPKA
jgi:hypothetical protein